MKNKDRLKQWERHKFDEVGRDCQNLSLRSESRNSLVFSLFVKSIGRVLFSMIKFTFLYKVTCPYSQNGLKKINYSMNTGIIGITDTKCFFDALSRSSRVKQDFRFSEQFLSKIQVYGTYQIHKNQQFRRKVQFMQIFGLFINLWTHSSSLDNISLAHWLGVYP